MYFNRKCKITFVCHGATIYSEEGRFSDAPNYPPLSEEGVDEIENVVKCRVSQTPKLGTENRSGNCISSVRNTGIRSFFLLQNSGRR